MKYIIFIGLLLIACSKPDNPQEAARLCGGNECCLSSYALIKDKGYFLATDNLCPENKKLNKLSCSHSLRWCE